MTATATAYNASKIQVLRGLEGVRHRPAMYIGSTDTKGLHHIVFEIVDNSIDEVLAGFCKKISVTVRKDGSIEISDDGRGVPIDMHPTEHRPAAEVVFTVLHAGGKFNNDTYKVSGGLHGVGAAVVNALSAWLAVEITRDGQHYRQRFESGGSVIQKPKITRASRGKSGTTVSFMPDAEIFEETTFRWDSLVARLKELSYLNPNLVLELNDERTGKSEKFVQSGGITSLVKALNEGKETLHRPITISGEKDGVIVEASIQYHDGYTETIQSYVNAIHTRDGGTHEAGLRSAITSALNEAAKRNGARKEGNVSGEDVREGLTTVLSVKMPNPQFDGQTKQRLGNADAKHTVESIVYQALVQEFAGNPALTRKLVQKALEAGRARSAAKKARELSRGKKAGIDSLAQKLAHCTSKDAGETELFIVEGDSAGGSAKQGRDRRTQAVLPLRGKILNVEKARIDKALEDDGVGAIIQAIGVGVGDDIDMSNLRYGKIILMADADSDGLHIRTLLLTLFYRFLRPLIEKGHVFIAQSPLYKVTCKGKIQYALSDAELEKILSALSPSDRKSAEIQRYKGLGELNPDQLRETTMDQKHRSLVRISIEDAVRAEEILTMLMGSDSGLRREFIEERAQFAKNLDI